jgi:hypothetical protein
LGEAGSWSVLRFYWKAMRSYWRAMRSLPSLLARAVLFYAAIPSVLAAVLVFNKPVGQWLVTTWTGISPWLGLVPLVLAFWWFLAVAVHREFQRSEEDKQRLRDRIEDLQVGESTPTVQIGAVHYHRGDQHIYIAGRIPGIATSAVRKGRRKRPPPDQLDLFRDEE